jgi:MFS family permease
MSPSESDNAAAVVAPAIGAPAPVVAAAASMSHRDANLAMTGLTMCMFVASLSNLVVLTALPRVVSDLHGTQAAYTWIITSSMLTITVCTPIWGRLSDMLDKKLLIQLCVAGYVTSSVCAGLAGTVWVIIACRVAIGICAGGIIVLMQSISVEITTPRNRARWVGYRGAIQSVATISAPSLGGFVAHHFGWRYCFFVGVPVAVVSVVVLRKTLNLPPPKAFSLARVDWIGAALLAGGISTVMLWVSVVGPDQGWASPPSLATLAFGLIVLGFAVVFERQAPHPMLPLELFNQREIMLCAIGGGGTGVALFGSAVFLAIYLQIGRGLNPQIAGLMALPEAAGTLLGSLIVSHLIARRGRYKLFLIIGATLVTAGFSLLSTIGVATPLAFVGLCVAMIGAGLGIVGENLVLVVQTAAPPGSAGAAGALVAFFRMLGGVLCVAGLGALLSGHVALEVRSRGMTHFDAHVVPRLSTLSAASRGVMEAAYAHAAATVYLACVPAGLLILFCVCLMREKRLEEDKASTRS